MPILKRQNFRRAKKLIDRRGFVLGAGATGAALGAGFGTVLAQTQNAADFTLHIARAKIELAPGKVIDTFAYNGVVPGPLLRVREGLPVTIDVANETDIEDIVHWHGLHLPAVADGAMEEGSPMIARGNTQRYSFTAKPSGTRWYHSHNIAGTDLTRSIYAGMYGFFVIDPTNNPARYDREVMLAVHHWEPKWVSMQDIGKGPPPDNGLEVLYGSASFNDKMLGHGEPIRVRQGERVLFRLLNASPTQNVTLALAGHRLDVVTLDGNPVPTSRTVDTLFLAPAERADVVVEMNHPGVWILGSVREDDRKLGLGMVIEYANEQGPPQWQDPANAAWDYTIFGTDRAVPEPDHRLELLFEKIPGGRGGYNRWILNGNSWPNTRQLLTTEVGKRYRLVMTNKSGDNHPIHLHRHTFEVTKIGDKKTAGLMKDTINMTRFSSVEVDFVAADPGPSLLHCHHQDHQDEGFMGLVTYI